MRSSARQGLAAGNGLLRDALAFPHQLLQLCNLVLQERSFAAPADLEFNQKALSIHCTLRSSSSQDNSTGR